MDVLTYIVTTAVDSLDSLPSEFCMLFMRFALFLAFLTGLALLVRELKPPYGVMTLLAQTAAVILSLVIAFAMPLSRLSSTHGDARKTVVITSLIIMLTLPALFPAILIRRRGYQSMIRWVFYALETTVIVIQGLVLLMR